MKASSIVLGFTCIAGIKLLGFKDTKELAFEDNVKHSLFIYPDELVRLNHDPPSLINPYFPPRNILGASGHSAPCSRRCSKRIKLGWPVLLFVVIQVQFSVPWYHR